MAYELKRRRPMGEINVVPYIDVMLVLLVIFMITAPMMSQGIKVELPQAEAEPVPQQDREPLVVSVDAAGRYFVNVGGPPEEVLDADGLLTRVAAALRLHPETPVYVRGDRNVPYGKVVGAMSLLKQAGVSGVGLMTENPDG